MQNIFSLPKIQTIVYNRRYLREEFQIIDIIDFRVTIDSSPPPPPQHTHTPRNFVELSYLKEHSFLHRIREVCTLAVGALPCGNSLFTLPMCKITVSHKFSQIRHTLGLLSTFYICLIWIWLNYVAKCIGRNVLLSHLKLW